MSAKGKTVEENRAETAAPEVAGSTGRRARSSFMMKNFADQDYINKNVVSKGKGTMVLLGRIFGTVTSVTEKKGTLPNGEPSVSQVFNGIFETESYLDGEVSTPTSIFFPNSFALPIKGMFAADETIKAVNIDADVGVEATGKSIPYAWVVFNHIENEAMSPLKVMKAARGKPAGLPAPVKAAVLTDQSK